MDINWVEALEQYGDPVERMGIVKYGLGRAFPKYAEFWGKYVLPNRDSSDPSKLRTDIDPKLENIINSHYSVFYQLTISLHQLNNPSNTLLDVAAPFYHLGVCIDLVERTFITALNAKSERIVEELDPNTFHALVAKFLEEQYAKRFKKFAKSYRPVSINLHNLSDLFREHVPDHAEFLQVATNIRHYRNSLIHSLHPLKVEINNKVYIPKEKYLEQYADGQWSSKRSQVNLDHYSIAGEVTHELIDILIKSMNRLWETLLNWMEDMPLRLDNLTGFSQFKGTIPYFESGQASGYISPNMDKFPNDFSGMFSFRKESNPPPWMKSTRNNSENETDVGDETSFNE